MSYYRAVDSSQNDFLKHYGVKGMKWGVRRKAKKLDRLTRLGMKYDHISKAWRTESKRREREAVNKGGALGYGRAYNYIHQAESAAKQFKKYSDFYTKRANRYMKKLSKKYIMKYDVVTGRYTLAPKSEKRTSS